MHKINLCHNLTGYRSGFVRQNSSLISFKYGGSWIILNPIEQAIKLKIEKVGVPLKEWGVNIYRGILTGYNDAFIIDKTTKDKLLSIDPKSVDIIRPILRGKDVKRYRYDFANLWLINTHNGNREKGLKPINIDDYPAIKSHLDTFYPELEKRLDKGISPYNLRNCAYMDDFNKLKLVWKRVGSHLKFAYDEANHLALDSTCFATGNSIKYLVALLNSKMGAYLLKDSPQTGTGDLLISVQAVEPLLIPHISPEANIYIEALVDQMLLARHEDQMQIEKEINQFIYGLYDLEKEEKDFIDLQ